ncbi:MAG: SRPBCC family protein [Solirubrobacterales bacterium]|nr:SRPBCC family protein [Solirubrobacterales bacterium]MBV9714738.1 SRPBCC family protein [Solirubrobacterales bacterium]
MKELRGTAGASVDAPLERAQALLEAVDGYPTWYPEVVKQVEVLERGADGPPQRVQAKLHFAQGPIARDFRLLLAVAVERPELVRLTRIPHEPGDPERFEVTWRLARQTQTQTRIDLELRADLDVPRFVPVASIGDSLARGFVAAAVRQLTG